MGLWNKLKQGAVTKVKEQMAFNKVVSAERMKVRQEESIKTARFQESEKAKHQRTQMKQKISSGSGSGISLGMGPAPSSSKQKKKGDGPVIGRGY